MTENRSAKFLDLIRRSERGRLKVYLGYGPGVGKTFQMLQEAHRIKADGIDVVVGFVETHGRRDTESLVSGLEVLPRRQLIYHGIAVDEFDIDACLARRPQVAIVDELPHTNLPGSRHNKRYQDVQDLLSAGIHVITAMNVQHLESLYDTIERLVNVKVRERVPDAVLADADQVVNIDVAPEDLQKRLRDGKIYPQQRIATSLENFFKSDNLEHLREMSFREIAGHIDTRRREKPEAVVAGGGSDQIMVCLSSRGPSSAQLLRYGSRLAGRLNRNWYAVYVQTPSEDPLKIDAGTQRLLTDTLTLANQLGATVFTFKGIDVAETILRFAGEYHVGQIVIGRPHSTPLWKRLIGRRSVAERLIFLAREATIVVVDADADDAPKESPSPSLPPAEPAAATDAAPVAPRSVLDTLTPARIVFFDAPPTAETVYRELILRISQDLPQIDAESVLRSVMDREAQGSTHLNEGIALPHARVKGLSGPQAAIGIMFPGLQGDDPARPKRIMCLLLTPADRAAEHLRSIAVIARQLSRPDVRQTMETAHDPKIILGAISQHADPTRRH